MLSAFIVICCLFLENGIATKKISSIEGVVCTSATNNIKSSYGQINYLSSVFYENKGKDEHKSLYFSVPKHKFKNLAYFRYQEEGEREPIDLKPSDAINISSSELDSEVLKNFVFFQIDLVQPLIPLMRVNINYNLMFVNGILPFPEFLSPQSQPSMFYTGNTYLDSIYVVKRQITSFSCQECVIISQENKNNLTFIRKNDRLAVFDNLQQAEPLTQNSFTLYFKSFSQNIANSLIHRKVYISEYNYVEFVEHHVLENRANKVKGEFSRLWYSQAKSSLSHVANEFIFKLPENSYHLYYRDSVGNISTSVVMEDKNSKFMIVDTRFPLMGGWNTEFTIKYKVPIESMLKIRKSSPDLKIFNANLFGAMHNIQQVDKLILEIVFPEHSKEIELNTQNWKLDFTKEIKKTFGYLDVIGRPTLRFEAHNLVALHNTKIKIQFVHEQIYLLWKPGYVSILFFITFLSIIVGSRIFAKEDTAFDHPKLNKIILEVNSVEKLAKNCLFNVAKYVQNLEDLSRKTDSNDDISKFIESHELKIDAGFDSFVSKSPAICRLSPDYTRNVEETKKKLKQYINAAQYLGDLVRKIKSGELKPSEFDRKKAVHAKELKFLIDSEKSVLMQQIAL